MPEVQIRKKFTAVEEIFHEGGPISSRPLRRAAALAVIHNPFAGAYVKEIAGFMDDLKPLGLEMARSLVKALGGDPKVVEGYGKGAIIGSHKGSCRLYKTTGTVLVASSVLLLAVAGKCAVCLLPLIVSPLQQTASLARRRRSISRTRSARRKQRRLPDSRYTYIPSHRVSIQAA